MAVVMSTCPVRSCTAVRAAFPTAAAVSMSTVFPVACSPASNIFWNVSWSGQLLLSKTSSWQWKITLSCVWQNVGLHHRVCSMKTPTEIQLQNTAMVNIPQSFCLFESCMIYATKGRNWRLKSKRARQQLLLYRSLSVNGWCFFLGINPGVYSVSKGLQDWILLSSVCYAPALGTSVVLVLFLDTSSTF